MFPANGSFSRSSTHGMHNGKHSNEPGEDISGTLEQLIYGPYPWIDSGVLDRLPLPIPESQ